MMREGRNSVMVLIGDPAMSRDWGDSSLRVVTHTDSSEYCLGPTFTQRLTDCGLFRHCDVSIGQRTHDRPSMVVEVSDDSMRVSG